MKYTTDPYENLANAIVASAAKDYIKLYKRYLRRPALGYPSELSSLEKFFYSGWYHTLTDVDSDYMVRLLKEKAQREFDGKSSGRSDYDC